MRETLVLTVLGPDRPGLVEALAAGIAACDGNWEGSHMTRLAGQFAGILLVTIEPARAAELVLQLRALDARGLQVVARPSEPAPISDGARLRLQVTADDRPGIIRDVSRVLAERGVNVEELQTEVTSAPMSGEPLFTARALLRVPPTVALADLRAGLEALTGELMVDLIVD